jgi:hypothetical protein
MPDVVRACVREILIKKDYSVLQEREQLFYVRLPEGWVAQGRIHPGYGWKLDWDSLKSGATSPPPADRLHGLLEAGYTHEALRVLAQEKSPTWWLMTALKYELLGPEELAGRPWDGASCRAITEAGELVQVEAADL